MGPEILSLISAGGDLAVIAVVYALYRIDRRLFAVEMKLEGKEHGLVQKTG